MNRRQLLALAADQSYRRRNEGLTPDEAAQLRFTERMLAWQDETVKAAAALLGENLTNRA